MLAKLGFDLQIKGEKHLFRLLDRGAHALGQPEPDPGPARFGQGLDK